MAIKWGKKDVIAAFEAVMSQTPGQPAPNIAEQIQQITQKNKVIKPQ